MDPPKALQGDPPGKYPPADGPVGILQGDAHGESPRRPPGRSSILGFPDGFPKGLQGVPQAITPIEGSPQGIPLGKPPGGNLEGNPPGNHL